MKDKIPVRIDLVGDSDGADIEIFMDLESFEGSGTTIRKDIRKFKQNYIDTIEMAKKLDVTKRDISTMRRWKVCKILADFNSTAANKFKIINFKQAYARDFGLPIRSIRTYLDFGRHFSEDDVKDDISYSVYAELCFKINHLISINKFDSAKKYLLDMHQKGTTPTRDEYRKYLKTFD